MTTAPATPAAGSIFAARYRGTTLGILILMTIIAFEAMAVATALPTAARDLHGLAAYGWTFTGFMVASVVGMVVSGQRSDLRGPRLPLIVGLGLFITGLILGGTAQTMWLLVGARVVQGFAVGLLITAMYVVMGEVYPDVLRPKMFAALASAWIVPGLVGPIVAGAITEHLSWRWVFGGLAPFVAAGGLLLLPSLRLMRTTTAEGNRADPSRIWFALLTAAGIAGLADIGQAQHPINIVLAALGLGAMIIGLRRLLPARTASFVTGVPAAIAFRGVTAGIFGGMESIIPLTLTVQHHYSPTMSGVPLMLTAIGWAIASDLQSRLPHPNRAMLVGTGLAFIATGGLAMALVATQTVPGWGAFLAWPVAGFGAGFAITSSGVVLLESTNDAERGSHSSSLQLSDSAMTALTAAFAGAFVALAAHGRISYGAGLGTVFATLSVLGIVAITRAPRLASGRARVAAAETVPTDVADRAARAVS